MRKSSLGILVFLVVALVVAFLVMKSMQNPSAIKEKAEQATTQAVQSAVDTVNKEDRGRFSVLTLGGCFGKI